MERNRLPLSILAVTLIWARFPASLVASPQAMPKGPAEIVREHFENAQKAQQRGEPIRAESEYRQALGLALEQLGLIYHGLGELDQAEFAYRSAAEAKTDSDVTLLGLAIVYLRKGEFQKGIETVRNILAEKPFHAGARHLLGKLYFSMNRFDAAALELEEAARLAPDDYSVAHTLAFAYLKQKHLDKARKIFDRLLSKLGETPQLHILFGGAYRETEFPDQAIEEFKRAIALDPKYPRAHYYLGLSYLSQGGRNKVPEALVELQTELRLRPEEYLANYLLGLVYLNERQLEESIPYLQKAMRLDPQKPDPPLYLGQALSLLGQDEKAVPILLRAIELTEDPSRNQYQIANSHYLLGQALRRQGKIEEAKKHLELAANYKAKSAIQDQERLQVYLKSGAVGTEEFRDAVTNMKGAIVLKPEPPSATERQKLETMEKFYAQVASNTYNQVGLLHAGRSDFSRAAQNFERAARWDPEIPDVHYNVGLAHFRAQNYSEAIPPLERARARQPERTPVRVLLGLSYFFVEEYRRAAEQLAPLADTATEDLQVMHALGLSLAYSGERERGEQILRRLLQQYPQVAGIQMALGQVLALSGDYGTASEAFSKAKALDPNLPETHYYAGLALLRQSRFKEAAEEFTREIARNPKHVKAQYHLGFTSIILEEVEEGVKRMEEAIRLNPSYAEAYYEIGKVLLQKGQLEKALSNLEKAAQLDPNKSFIHYQLSRAYLQAGRRDAAESALARYRDLKAQERVMPR